MTTDDERKNIKRRLCKKIRLSTNSAKAVQHFEECIQYAENWRSKRDLHGTGDAFSNVVKSAPCCQSLEKELLSNQPLLKKAQKFITECRDFS